MLYIIGRRVYKLINSQTVAQPL